MSNNVHIWKTKKLVGLRIPVASLFKHPRKDFHPVTVMKADDVIEYSRYDNVVRGKLMDGGTIFVVEEIDCAGEGSGTFLNWILEPALEDSTGELIFACNWEDGEITKTTVKNGEITEEEIDW